MQRKLDYTQEEVRVLKEIVAVLTGNARLSFTADQRRRLAVAGKALRPEERKKCCQLVKPGTLLGWFPLTSAPPDQGIRRALHYMTELFHQGIGGQLIRNVGPTNDKGADGKVACRSRLGGLLNFYYREAARASAISFGTARVAARSAQDRSSDHWAPSHGRRRRRRDLSTYASPFAEPGTISASRRGSADPG
jgi:hypothetical protein